MIKISRIVNAGGVWTRYP